MTSSLMVTRIKPNPIGKDRNRYGGASATQLGAEWVDIRNATSSPISLASVEMYHRAYSGGDSRWAKVMGFTGALGAGQIVRVHSGQVRPVSMLRQEDLDGADHHVFSGQDNYVWNNAEGDSPGLWNSAAKQWIDSASYDASPPEGVVLIRSGDKLVPAQQAASRW